MTPAHVLVVEDNLVNQKVTFNTLAQIGIHADLAKDGLEAIACFKQKSYDLVIMDCQMPRLDGWDATRAIRRLEAGTGKHCPIIALTAQSLTGDREKCLLLGMDDYLTKPVDALLLQRSVKGHLAGMTALVPAEAACRRELSLALQSLGTVMEAASGRESIHVVRDALMKKEPFDFIALDNMMSFTNGHAALVAIRAREEIAGIPPGRGAVMMMTSSLAVCASVIAAFREQCSGYLTKLIDLKKLFVALHEHGVIAR